MICTCKSNTAAASILSLAHFSGINFITSERFLIFQYIVISIMPYPFENAEMENLIQSGQYIKISDIFILNH